MEKLTVTDMDKLICQTDNHKIQALHKVFKSIAFYPKFQRDLVVSHLGYKAVNRSEITYTNNATGIKMTFKEVESVVLKSAEANYKVDLLLKTKTSFSKLAMPQKVLILNYLGITIEQEQIFYFKKN